MSVFLLRGLFFFLIGACVDPLKYFQFCELKGNESNDSVHLLRGVVHYGGWRGEVGRDRRCHAKLGLQKKAFFFDDLNQNIHLILAPVGQHRPNSGQKKLG